MKKHYLLLVAVVFCAFGCSKSDKASMPYYSGGGAKYNRAPQMAVESALAMDMAYETQGSAGPEIPLLENNVERKLVKQANIRIRTDNLDAADASVSALMEKHEAYTASTEIEENSRYYSIRVPSTEYNAFLEGTHGLGRMLRRSETTEDVTLRYYDLEGRLNTKRELLKTFQSYLEKAKNIEEILAVETRMADLHNEIDWNGKELRNLANRVDYATVDLSVLGPVTATPDNGVTVGEKFKGLFGAFGGFLSTVAVVLVGIVVYGIPILLLLVLFFWLFFGKIGLLKKLWRVAAGKK